MGSETLKRSNPRQNNISLVQMISPRSRSELKLYDIIAINVLSNTDSDVELYLTYGS